MNPYERLLAEEVPTGTFGHAQPPRPAQRHTASWTADEQAQHRTDLVATLDNWAWDEEQRHADRRHLRLITDKTDTHAA